MMILHAATAPTYIAPENQPILLTNSTKHMLFPTMICVRKLPLTAVALLLCFPSRRCIGFQMECQSFVNPKASTYTQRLSPWKLHASSNNDSVQVNAEVVSCMPPPFPEDLKNTYYLLRHGQSTANVAGVISSARSLVYSDKHGLTTVGVEQGEKSAEALVSALEKNSEAVKSGDKILFVSSPFARARQTAEACLRGLTEQEELQYRIQKLGLEVVPDIVLRDKLMERYFGRLDSEAIYTYAYVWPVDKMDVTHTAFDVESVAAVCTRIRELIVEDLEEEYDGNYHVVLTSHADVLQITQLYAAGAENVGTFSSYRFANGEVRLMARSIDSLPEPVPLEAPQRGTQV